MKSRAWLLGDSCDHVLLVGLITFAPIIEALRWCSQALKGKLHGLAQAHLA
jgi:hypothetical protein